jgi:hypothetical protein
MRLSPSQIGMYRRCSLQWFFRYRAGIKLKPVLRIVKGSAVHTGVETGYKYTLSTGERSPVDLVTDATAQAFDEDHAQGITIEEDDPKPEEAKDRAVDLARLHHKKVALKVEPAIVEKMIYWDVPNGPRMMGKLDLMEQNGAIRDLKTSGRRESLEALRVNSQLALYVAGMEQAGLPTGDIFLDRLVDTQEPYVQTMDDGPEKDGKDGSPLRLARNQVDVARTEAVARAVSVGIEKQLFVPCDDIKTCSWCGYRKICWSAKWWEYLLNPDLARRAARAAMEGDLLPEGVRSVPAPKQEETP